MAAQVDYEFKRNFILGEEHLRRCIEIVANRAAVAAATPVLLKISRADAFVYTTESVDTVLREDNGGGLAIDKVEVIIVNERIDFSLSFSRKKGASLRVSGESRDDVFLLTSEVKQYVETAILVRWGIQYDSQFLIRIFGVLVFGFASFGMAMSIPAVDDLKIQSVLASADLAEKLNFLIDRGKGNGFSKGFAILSVVSMILVAFGGQFFIGAWNWIYPTNQFGIGMNISILEKRRVIRERLVWVVAASVVLGLLVEFGADYLKK